MGEGERGKEMDKREGRGRRRVHRTIAHLPARFLIDKFIAIKFDISFFPRAHFKRLSIIQLYGNKLSFIRNFLASWGMDLDDIYINVLY